MKKWNYYPHAGIIYAEYILSKEKKENMTLRKRKEFILQKWNNTIICSLEMKIKFLSEYLKGDDNLKIFNNKFPDIKNELYAFIINKEKNITQKEIFDIWAISNRTLVLDAIAKYVQI